MRGSLDQVYLRSLLRLHLSISFTYLGVFALMAVGLPVVFWLFPDLAGVRLLGVPLVFWLLGVVSYPMLVLLGGLYVRSVEAAEAEYDELVTGP
jgi:putative solute:sodium symporter small subunit